MLHVFCSDLHETLVLLGRIVLLLRLVDFISFLQVVLFGVYLEILRVSRLL